MHYLIIPYMAIMNRLRGADKFDTIAKIIIGVSLGMLLWIERGRVDNYLIWIIAMVVLYRIGEAFGWGKWIASILNRNPQFSEKEGCSIIFGIEVWDGIHHIANFFIKEKADYLNYSRLALAIRGFYWWFPVYMAFYIFGNASFYRLCITLPLVSLSFPISVEIGRLIKFKLTKLMDDPWENSEVIYGILQGVFLYSFLWGPIWKIV